MTLTKSSVAAWFLATFGVRLRLGADDLHPAVLDAVVTRLLQEGID